MLLLALLILPLLCGLLLLVSPPAQAKRLAFVSSLLVFCLSAAAFYVFQSQDPNGLLGCNLPWIRSIGANIALNTDGISILLVLLTTSLVPFIILTSFRHDYKNTNVFYALILFMEMALLGVFTATDGFLFYIFWELALIPIWFICLLWGGKDRARITFKFFVYTLAGSLFMLIGLIYLYRHTQGSFAIRDLYAAGHALSSGAQTFVFWCFFLAFAIKIPIFPFHTWQPDTYTSAPTPGTMLLSGIMLKMGTYGLLRWLLPVVPGAVQEWSGLVMTLSVIGIVYASCIAIVQTDLKRLIAYSSIAHVGLIVAGTFSLTTQGITGAVIQMVAHGINVVGLFFISDIIDSRTKTRTISDLGGIRNVAPAFAVLYLIVMLGSVALPLTNGFVGEVLLLTGVFQYGLWTAIFAGLTVILGAVYMLRSYQGIMLGETNGITSSFSEIGGNEKWILTILALVIVLFGVFPSPLLDIASPAVEVLLNSTGFAK
ncbi:MAG: NADH-quinone oxidoreductase subunit M [Bacteroidia bacterium]|nr:NADH-quinone oxidoreductase subunit M [Bacteroidia bacterium]